MKKYLRLTSLIILLAISGCECSRTIEGNEIDCIGAFDDQNPNYHYRVSVRNVIWTILGSGGLIIPIIWLVTNVKCPTYSKTL